MSRYALGAGAQHGASEYARAAEGVHTMVEGHGRRVTLNGDAHTSRYGLRTTDAGWDVPCNVRFEQDVSCQRAAEDGWAVCAVRRGRSPGEVPRAARGEYGDIDGGSYGRAGTSRRRYGRVGCSLPVGRAMFAGGGAYVINEQAQDRKGGKQRAVRVRGALRNVS